MPRVYKPKVLPSPSPPTLDAKKVFEVQLEALKDAYKEMVEANQKIAGILLIVLGWFTAKDNPLIMLCISKGFAYVALAFTLVGYLALHHLFRMIFERGRVCEQSLKQNGHAEELYGRYRLTKSMLWCGLFGQYAMLVGISGVIFYKYVDLWDKTCHP